jgi:hypothetical protein
MMEMEFFFFALSFFPCSRCFHHKLVLWHLALIALRHRSRHTISSRACLFPMHMHACMRASPTCMVTDTWHCGRGAPRERKD